MEINSKLIISSISVLSGKFISLSNSFNPHEKHNMNTVWGGNFMIGRRYIRLKEFIAW